MFSLPRLLKVAYLLILGGAVLALCKPAPVRAQRAIAYPALPAQINITVTSNPFTAILTAQSMLLLAGSASMLTSGATILGSGTMNGGGFGGFNGGMGGGGFNGGGFGGMQGGFGGGGFGMGGGMGMRGGGGMGGFAGKGMGGFNGKKAL